MEAEGNPPVGVLVDGNHNEILIENIDFLGPLFHPFISGSMNMRLSSEHHQDHNPPLLCSTQVGVVLHRVSLRLGPRGQPLVEIGRENVGSALHLLYAAEFLSLEGGKYKKLE